MIALAQNIHADVISDTLDIIEPPSHPKTPKQITVAAIMRILLLLLLKLLYDNHNYYSISFI